MKNSTSNKSPYIVYFKDKDRWVKTKHNSMPYYGNHLINKGEYLESVITTLAFKFSLIEGANEKPKINYTIFRPVWSSEGSVYQNDIIRFMHIVGKEHLEYFKSAYIYFKKNKSYIEAYSINHNCHIYEGISIQNEITLDEKYEINRCFNIK